MRLYRKSNRLAVWLADGTTRQHVPNETALKILEQPLPDGYGKTILLDPSADLATLGRQVLSMTGDI